MRSRTPLTVSPNWLLLSAQAPPPPPSLRTLSAFYFDTALSGSPAALPSLLAFARPGHVLFGSDSPYIPNETVGYFTNGLDSFAGLDPAGHQAVNRGNAEALFPRLAPFRG